MVSCFGPGGGAIGGGWEADNGREAVGGFGGGKKFVDDMSSVADGGKEAIGELPPSRTDSLIRTVSCGFTPGSEGLITGGCGN
jgi:hypothetical protein